MVKMGSVRLDRAAAIQASTVAEVFMVVLMVAALVGVYLASSQGGGGEEGGGGGENVEIGTDVGDQAPGFTLTDIDGNEFSLSDYRGKVVILDFMAISCIPCVGEMFHLNEINDSYGGENVVIMSIDIDPTDGEDAIRWFKETYGGDWIFASGPSIGMDYLEPPSYPIPTLYIIDQQGVIAYKNVGVTSSSTLSSEIDKLL